MGELRGLSKWRARFLGIGLEESLIDNATEKAGMLLVQIERFNRILASVVQQVHTIPYSIPQYETTVPPLLKSL